MKNTPIQNRNESAPRKHDYTQISFPANIDTVQACVLADLLDSNKLSGMSGVRNFSSTRLAAFIHVLAKKYGWPFERNDIVTGTRDGRVPSITVYSLSQDCLEYAFANGAREWISAVRLAEKKRRREAHQVQKIAAKINATRYQVDPKQAKLWGDI